MFALSWPRCHDTMLPCFHVAPEAWAASLRSACPILSFQERDWMSVAPCPPSSSSDECRLSFVRWNLAS